LNEAIAEAEKTERAPIYQCQFGSGAWIDQDKDSYDYNVRYGQATARIVYTSQPAAQQEPDRLHLAAMDIARKQADRIAELERQLADQPTYERIGTIYSESWPIVECGWRFALSDQQCNGYAVESAVFIIAKGAA
jgi:hypothetical protein